MASKKAQPGKKAQPKKNAASKSTAKKTAAKKTPAKKAPAKKVPAKKPGRPAKAKPVSVNLEEKVVQIADIVEIEFDDNIVEILETAKKSWFKKALDFIKK